MKVLLVGSGAREHAMAAAIAQSPLLEKLFIAPGNPGTESLGQNIPIQAEDVPALIKFAQAEKIDLVVPGPEAPLVAGLADLCIQAGILCAGPTQQAAQLEGSKHFTKTICDSAHIPTAQWKQFTNKVDALSYAQTHPLPMVIKADGLAAGKGVIIASTREEALAAISDMMDGKTVGHAGHSIVIEEFLQGEEVSLFAFCDGQSASLIGAAQDHKRIGENDTGPNTGGMGAISPPPFFDHKAQQKALQSVITPMLTEMKRRGIPFRGIIFAGLMLTQNGPKLIEYNTRFGDPEAQTLLIRLKSDLLEALYGVAQGHLPTKLVQFSEDFSACIVLAGRGYPGKPATGSPITGLQEAASLPDVFIFQAATKYNEHNTLIGNGGRVLSVCATAPTLREALKKAYQAIEKIHWQDGIWRQDIGAKAMAHFHSEPQHLNNP
ncbi:phosphoribosylamine--glycine ligase [Entomobacter blattae]|uniref:Phosphoribosylamine--glycine ligase n=1 Tax=Entomobacter blattae TaxID=2762277 RepID=A0A7H1NPI7_9PROT|nr:phosphoribosylamine--glycine ligase [Entomobacter blattae]QNT77697.1 Phosphoribosylamine--glycine ligase [Entomobacter blattae]